MNVLLNSLFDKTMNGLNRTLDLTWRRGEAIASNIANAETPGYRATDLDFAGELKKAFEMSGASLMKTNAQHLDVGGTQEARLVKDLSGVTRADGNNVDVDIQMGRLGSNAGRFSIASNLLRKKLQIVTQAIRAAER